MGWNSICRILSIQKIGSKIACIMEIVILGLIAFLIANRSSETDMTNIPAFNRWDSLIQKYANLYNVPFDWMKAIMIVESDLGRAKSVKIGLEKPDDIINSVSFDGKSWGLMQLTLPTTRMFEPLVTERGLNDPEISVRLAAKYLQWLISKKGRDEENVIRSYNGGAGWKGTVLGPSMTLQYWNKYLAAKSKLK